MVQMKINEKEEEEEEKEKESCTPSFLGIGSLKKSKGFLGIGSIF